MPKLAHDGALREHHGEPAWTDVENDAKRQRRSNERSAVDVAPTTGSGEVGAVIDARPDAVDAAADLLMFAAPPATHGMPHQASNLQKTIFRDNAPPLGLNTSTPFRGPESPDVGSRGSAHAGARDDSYTSDAHHGPTKGGVFSSQNASDREEEEEEGEAYIEMDEDEDGTGGGYPAGMPRHLRHAFPTSDPAALHAAAYAAAAAGGPHTGTAHAAAAHATTTHGAVGEHGAIDAREAHILARERAVLAREAAVAAAFQALSGSAAAAPPAAPPPAAGVYSAHEVGLQMIASACAATGAPGPDNGSPSGHTAASVAGSLQALQSMAHAAQVHSSHSIIGQVDLEQLSAAHMVSTLVAAATPLEEDAGGVAKHAEASRAAIRLDAAAATKRPPALKRCGDCAGCRRRDCDRCINCRDRPSNGGPGLRKKACEQRRCLQPVPADQAPPPGVRLTGSAAVPKACWAPTPWPKSSPAAAMQPSAVPMHPPPPGAMAPGAMTNGASAALSWATLQPPQHPNSKNSSTAMQQAPTPSYVGAPAAASPAGAGGPAWVQWKLPSAARADAEKAKAAKLKAAATKPKSDLSWMPPPSKYPSLGGAAVAPAPAPAPKPKPKKKSNEMMWMTMRAL